jgi:hypothetical protein
MKIYLVLSLIINIISSDDSEWRSPCENTTAPTSYESCKKKKY